MASSDYDTYGKLTAKNVYLDESGIRFHDASDDSKSVTLKVSGLSAGNADIELPTSAGALLNAASNLPSANLTGIESLGQPGVADGDVFLYADSSNANAPAGLSGADLKTYVGSLPSGTDAQILVNNTGSYASVAMGGDCSVDNSGAVSIGSNKVTTAMLQTNSVDADALADNAVDSAAIATGAIDNANKFGANVVDANALADNAVDAGALATDAVVEAKIQNNAVTKDKMADAPTTYGTAEASKLVACSADKDVAALRHVTAEGTVEAGASEAFRLGNDADNSWRVMISGGGDLVFERKEAGTWNQKGSFTAT